MDPVILFIAMIVLLMSLIFRELGKFQELRRPYDFNYRKDQRIYYASSMLLKCCTVILLYCFQYTIFNKIILVLAWNYNLFTIS